MIGISIYQRHCIMWRRATAAKSYWPVLWQPKLLMFLSGFKNLFSPVRLFAFTAEFYQCVLPLEIYL